MRILTCSEFKVDCLTSDQDVDANPDIAGKGVILSFLATTSFAFVIAFTVMFLNRYEKIVTRFRKHILGNNNPYSQNFDPYWRSASFWARVLSKNLLSFSDTQLVTGLAIQFTALIQHCRLSIYHFQVVVELAFLTTITHMLALVALRDYFVRNRWINLPRICFMLGNLALLGYTSYIAYNYDLAGLHASQSLACFYQGERPGFRTAFAGRWATLLVGAIGGHVTVILAMYFLSDNNNSWSLKWFGALLRTWIIAPGYAIYGLTMGGIALHRTQALGNPSVNINGSEKEWGFGQFLPLLLLALPLFAGWESFWEEQDPDPATRFGTSTAHTSRHGSRNPLNSYELVNSKPSNNGNSSTIHDNSELEARIESITPSPVHTPRLQFSTPPVGTPSPPGSPRLGPHLTPPISGTSHQRQRSSSRSTELRS